MFWGEIGADLLPVPPTSPAVLPLTGRAPIGCPWGKTAIPFSDCVETSASTGFVGVSDDAVSCQHLSELIVGEQLHLLGGHHNVADKATATLIDTAGLGLALGVVGEDETIAEDARGVVVVLHILWGFDYITKIVIFSLSLAVLALGLGEVFDEGAVEDKVEDEDESGNHNVWGSGYITKVTLFSLSSPLVAQPGQP